MRCLKSGLSAATVNSITCESGGRPTVTCSPSSVPINVRAVDVTLKDPGERSGDGPIDTRLCESLLVTIDCTFVPIPAAGNMTQASSSMSSPTMADQGISSADQQLRRSRRKRLSPSSKQLDAIGGTASDDHPQRPKKPKPKNQNTRPIPASNQSMIDTAESQDPGGIAVIPESKPSAHKSDGTSIYRRNYMRQYRLMQREKIQLLPEADRQWKLEQIRAGVRERVRRFRLRKALGLQTS